MSPACEEHATDRLLLIRRTGPRPRAPQHRGRARPVRRAAVVHPPRRRRAGGLALPAAGGHRHAGAARARHRLQRHPSRPGARPRHGRHAAPPRPRSAQRAGRLRAARPHRRPPPAGCSRRARRQPRRAARDGHPPRARHARGPRRPRHRAGRVGARRRPRDAAPQLPRDLGLRRPGRLRPRRRVRPARGPARDRPLQRLPRPPRPRALAARRRRRPPARARPPERPPGALPPRRRRGRRPPRGGLRTGASPGGDDGRHRHRALHARRPARAAGRAGRRAGRPARPRLRARRRAARPARRRRRRDGRLQHHMRDPRRGHPGAHRAARAAPPRAAHPGPGARRARRRRPPASRPARARRAFGVARGRRAPRAPRRRAGRPRRARPPPRDARRGPRAGRAPGRHGGPPLRAPIRRAAGQERIGVSGAAPLRAQADGLRDGRPLPPADAAVPALPSLLDRETMATVLRRSVRPGARIDDVRVTTVDYRPGSGATVAYDVSVAGRTQVAVASAGPAGCGDAARTPARLAIARALGADAPVARPLTYDAGLGALVHWYPLDLAMPVLAKPRAVLRLGDVVLKAYADDEAFRAGVDGLRIAGALALPHGPRLHGAFADLRLTVQPALAGDPVPRVRARHVAPAAGAMLRVLHESRVPGLTVATSRSLLDDVHESAALVAAVAPTLGPHALDLLARLEEHAPEADALVASHGDFNVSQFLDVDGGLAVLDFDEACLAAPALDLASYAANLVGGRAGDLERAREALDALLDGYGRRPANVDWYLAALLLRRARNPFRLHKRRWPKRIEQMLAAADEVLHP